MQNEQKNKVEPASKQSSRQNPKNDDLVTGNEEVSMRLVQILLDMGRAEVEGYDPPDGAQPEGAAGTK